MTVPGDDHTTLVGFECRDRKAVDDVTFVELTSAKHEATGIHVSVLYSTSGFSGPARTKAKAFGMRLVQATQGLDEDWPAWLRELKTAYWAELLLAPSDITIETSEGLIAVPPPDLPLVDADGSPLGEGLDLKCVVHAFIRQQMTDLLKDSTPGTNGTGRFTINLDSPISVADVSGKVHQVRRFEGKFTWDAPIRIPVDLRHRRVEGLPVVFGEGKLGNRKAEVHWIAGPAGTKTIGTRRIGTEPPQRLDMQPVDRGEGDASTMNRPNLS